MIRAFISALSPSRTAGAPQTGQVLQLHMEALSAGRFSLTTPLTLGIISPDL